MDINLLVVAFGNSRVQLGLFVGGELMQVRRLTHAEQPNFEGVVQELWGQIKDMENAEVAGCSVAPAVAEAWELIVEKVTGENVQWVGRDLDLPIKVTTKEPEKTGVDRVLVTAAAFEQLEKACVVVDAGTALTVNLCDNTGSLVGGAIAPGAQPMLESMHKQTAKLPEVKFEAPASDYGDDTESAMRHGVLQSLRGLVQSMAERWAERQGNWPEVIATGGDAAALFTDWEIVHAISPDLLLYGVALAYTKHHVKHGT
jgi:type III pantothenate kinase